MKLKKRKIKYSAIARRVGVCRKTVKRYITEYEAQVQSLFLIILLNSICKGTHNSTIICIFAQIINIS